MSAPSLRLLDALVERFLGRVDIVDPESFAAVSRRPCLYLANHQCAVESLLFARGVSPLAGRPITALVKSEHRGGWLGRLVELVYSYPGTKNPGELMYFERLGDDVEELFKALEERVRTAGVSILVHVEGTRRRSARRSVVKRMSPLWIDLAVRNGWPIVPVRFIGALPVEDPGHPQEVPVGCCKQIVRIGRPILPETLASAYELVRLNRVRAAINELSDWHSEMPEPPDDLFCKRVGRWVALTGIQEATAAAWWAVVESDETKLAGPVKTLVQVSRGAVENWGGVMMELDDGPEDTWLKKAAKVVFGGGGIRLD
jgi:1-acyl-sn-glycerol-3-phosphate acyltransferase